MLKNNFRYNYGSSITGCLTILIVFAVVLYPLIVLFLYSFGINVHNQAITISHYLQAIGDLKTIIAIKNTFYVATGVTLLAVMLGGGLAWVLTRTDIPFKRGFRMLILLTFAIPSYILAVAWIELLGRNGFINNILYSKIHLIDAPLNIYSLEGIILIMALHIFPLVFMTLTAALRMNDATLEMAAWLAGAGRLKTLFTITLPLILPSILSVSLLVFQQTLACFGVAAIIGLPGGNYILTTRIYSALSRLDLPMATSISVILLTCSGLVFYLYNLSLRKKRYININSNAQIAELKSLGKWKVPITILVTLILMVTTIIPLVTLIATSLLKSWGISLSIKNFTFNNYFAIFTEETIAVRAISNSIFYGIIAASITAILGIVISYISTKTVIKGRKFVEFVATWPLAVPGTVIAVAATLAWINYPIKLYGTPLIIIVTYIVACLPFGIRNINGFFQGMDPILENAARISGSSWLQTFKDITLPIIVPGIRTGWITSFLMVLREIPISIMLYSVGSETIGVLLYNMRSDTGGLEMVSAVAIIVIILTVLGNILIEKFGKSRMEKPDGTS